MVAGVLDMKLFSEWEPFLKVSPFALSVSLLCSVAHSLHCGRMKVWCLGSKLRLHRVPLLE